MSKFFINRPIVAMVISIIVVLAGIVSYVQLPVAQYPDIVPPEINVSTFYVGADALTVEQSVATPIEQQISGVDHMNYVESLNSNDGRMSMKVNFAIGSDPNTDQLLTQMRQGQATSMLPSDVTNYGVSVVKSTSSPLMLISLVSADKNNKQIDSNFLANHAFIFLNDALLRIPGVGQISVFGAGQYAMRIWLRPNDLARYNITVSEVMSAVKSQNKVNPVGSVGAEPVPEGQQNTYTLRTQGRLVSSAEFEDIIIRAKEDGSVVRLKDVASIERGAQAYNISSNLNGETAATIALYQLPGTNAVESAKKIREFLKNYKFPDGVKYYIPLDTTLAITEGLKEIKTTLFEAILLVIFVVFIFLQSFRATLIPLLAVPVSLIGTFAVFPLFGFSVNTLSLFVFSYSPS
jgi:HAE1 family hydrophobic/amphiphilic exporter-1